MWDGWDGENESLDSLCTTVRIEIDFFFFRNGHNTPVCFLFHLLTGTEDSNKSLTVHFLLRNDTLIGSITVRL